MKNFLPKIHQANLELNKKILQGNTSDVTLDSDLVPDDDQSADTSDNSLNEVLYAYVTMYQNRSTDVVPIRSVLKMILQSKRFK